MNHAADTEAPSLFLQGIWQYFLDVILDVINNYLTIQ